MITKNTASFVTLFLILPVVSTAGTVSTGTNKSQPQN